LRRRSSQAARRTPTDHATSCGASSLDDLQWDVAARHAAVQGLASYGVLVMRDNAANGFLVITQRESPEYQFTATTCR